MMVGAKPHLSIWSNLLATENTTWAHKEVAEAGEIPLFQGNRYRSVKYDDVDLCIPSWELTYPIKIHF